MKKTICLLMLLASIMGELCAQSADKSDKAFEVPGNIVFNRRFRIDLGKGNKVQIEVSDFNDLARLSDMDSLLRIFLKDLSSLKDSLADPLTSKHIDYVTDKEGRKKIRLQQTPPKGASYYLNNGDLAALRTEQDTVNIIGIITFPPKPKEKISLSNPRYYRIVLSLNDLSELPSFMNGMLKQKITTLQNNVNDRWPTVLGTGFHYLRKDPTITGDRIKGYTEARTGDLLTGYITINAENYKNYFVPSFSLGLRLTISNRERSYKWEPGLLWEPHYLFARDNQNKLHTYRNDFLTFTYGQGGIKDHDPRKDFSFSTVFSLGYLINRNGDYFDKNTYRLGAGKIQFYKTSIEPAMYFNNFFKGVSPGIRISQTF